MARGRMINKKISNSKRINDMPLQAQLLFTWLIPHLDCNGCFYGSAQMIKSLVVPRKNWSKKQIEGALVVMENSKNVEQIPLICRYPVNGEQYLFMPGFVGEQVGLRYDKEKSEFPTFDGKETEQIGQTTDTRGRGRGSRREEEVETKGSSRCLSKENIIQLYEENIGSVTESLENEIDLAIKRFTAAWVGDAIREAVLHNKPTWVYVAGILKNWERYGKETH